MNIRLTQNGQDLKEAGHHRHFRLEILDNGKVVYSKMGGNQINLSQFIFRCNAGLKDSSEDPSEEVKHNYVIQAVFELHMWPECKTANEQTEGLSWTVKM